MTSSRQRFDGEICGFGTASGCRVVVGRWTSTPYSPFADVMFELADGRRVLIAPSHEVADLISALYTFDEVDIATVVAERTPGGLSVTGGALHADVRIGGRDALGWCLRAVPQRVATSTAWATLVDPLARVLLRGVRTRGRTIGGREFYAATDRHHVTAVEASWHGDDLGELRDVVPAVRFGFSSTPRRPSIVRVVTTVIPSR
jgi:hypothetical protein